ncbi:MAG: hypothetical protein E6J34_09185 [Chloroflexi bacterium]|nr:MAG: hypothetical protein E6J34_09185 [Chloroflexota bacterium]
MDSSLHSTNLTAEQQYASAAIDHGEVGEAEEGSHIHLPNPSIWPFILSIAIFITTIGLLFIPDSPWLAVIGAPLILVSILGWGLEDPLAPHKEIYVVQPETYAHSKYKIGQEVVDKNGRWVGTVHARFDHHILVDRGGLAIKAYYVPHNLTEETITNNIVRLTVSGAELRSRELDVVPDDLYDEALDPGLPQLNGVPMFARGPLSPAETGHYNYGPNYPGINTDASGSFDREYVTPSPQKYVGERRRVRRASEAVVAQR